MAATTAPLLAAALLLAIAGVGKLAQPSTTVTALRAAGLPGNAIAVQMLAAVEMAIGVGAILWASPVAIAALGISYLGFAWFTWRLRRRQGATASCGCFGARTTPAHPIHFFLNAAVSLAAVAGLIWQPTDISAIPQASVLAGVPFLTITALLAWCLYLALTLLPEVLTAAAADPT